MAASIRIPSQMARQLRLLCRSSPGRYCRTLPMYNGSRDSFIRQSLTIPNCTYSTVPPPPPPQPHPSQQVPNYQGDHSAPPPPPPPSPSPRPPPRQKRRLAPYIFATLFFLVGTTTGHYMRLVVSPPPLPEPGTPEDEHLQAWIASKASQLPIVQSLSNDPNYTSWPAYSAFSAEEAPQRLTTGPLGGARGLGGYQHIFYNKKTGDVVNVLWIGGGLSGWPGVCHGGLLATVLDETLGRCVIARFVNKSGVTANLEVAYKAPTVTNSFVIVKAFPVLEGSTARKGFVKGHVETLNGKVLVEAKGLFVSPKQLALRAFEDPQPGTGF